jgi:hypothetical protein
MAAVLALAALVSLQGASTASAACSKRSACMWEHALRTTPSPPAGMPRTDAPRPRSARRARDAPPARPAGALIVAAQQAACGSLGSLDFFPAGAPPNEPPAWTQAAQAAAGNTDRGALWPIALGGTPQPLLSFLPSHPLLSPDAAAPAACGGGAAPSRRRALAESAAPAAAAAAAGVPAAFTWAATLDGAPVAGGSSPARLADVAAPPSWTQNVWGLPDVSGSRRALSRVAASHRPSSLRAGSPARALACRPPPGGGRCRRPPPPDHQTPSSQTFRWFNTSTANNARPRRRAATSWSSQSPSPPARPRRPATRRACRRGTSPSLVL